MATITTTLEHNLTPITLEPLPSISLAAQSKDSLPSDDDLPLRQPEASTTTQLAPDAEEVYAYPERGTKAWLVVVGAWCAMVPPIGLINSMGALHAWVGQHQLKGVSESKVGWIFSIHGFFLYVGSVLLGSVFDRYGVKPLVVAGSIGYLLSIFALSFCTEYIHFLLAFGVLGGISASCLWIPSVCAVAHWFSKRRSFATGVAYTSGGLGGIVFPFVIQYLAPLIGYAWTMRVIGFFSAAMFLAACLLLRTRIPPTSKAGLEFDFKALREPAFGTTALAVFLVESAIFVPLTYISSYAIHAGIEPQFASLLITFLNIGSVPGRILPGYFADRYGHFNVMIITSFFSTISIFTLWLTSGTNKATMTAFAVLFGFWSGASASLTPVCVAQVCRIEDYGKRNGTAYSLSSLSVLMGIPIAGALIDARGGDYTGLIIFGGSVYTATTLAFAVTRWVLDPKGLKVKV